MAMHPVETENGTGIVNGKEASATEKEIVIGRMILVEEEPDGLPQPHLGVCPILHLLQSMLQDLPLQRQRPMEQHPRLQPPTVQVVCEILFRRV